MRLEVRTCCAMLRIDEPGCSLALIAYTYGAADQPGSRVLRPAERPPLPPPPPPRGDSASSATSTSGRLGAVTCDAGARVFQLVDTLVTGAFALADKNFKQSSRLKLALATELARKDLDAEERKHIREQLASLQRNDQLLTSLFLLSAVAIVSLWLLSGR